MSIDPSLYWWAAAFLLLFLELYTRDLSFLVFSSAVMVAAITVAVGFPFFVQLIVICVIIFVGFKFFRPWALQYIPESVRRKTDWFSFSSSAGREQPVRKGTIVGQRGTALTVVDRYGGIVKVGQEDWQAKLESPSGAAEKGTVIQVLRMEGHIAVISVVKNDGNSPR